MTKIIFSILVGVFCGLGGYTFYYARGASYLSNDPAACVNCHIMREEYDGWQKSSHHDVATCNDCHTPHDFFGKYFTKAENGLHHSIAFTLQNFREPIMIREKNAKILNNNCRFCHRNLVMDITEHMTSADETNACTRCHADVGH